MFSNSLLLYPLFSILQRIWFLCIWYPSSFGQIMQALIASPYRIAFFVVFGCSDILSTYKCLSVGLVNISLVIDPYASMISTSTNGTCFLEYFTLVCIWDVLCLSADAICVAPLQTHPKSTDLSSTYLNHAQGFLSVFYKSCSSHFPNCVCVCACMHVCVHVCVK